MSTPHRSTSFADILDTIVDRLAGALGRSRSDGYVRIVLAPSPEDAPYRAEEGVHVVVDPPQPSGNGRYDTKVRRDVTVFVVSSNLSDTGGRDDLAALAHVRLEERVIDAVKDLYPASPAVGTAVQVQWKGGARPQRMVRADTSLVVSSVVFEVTYAFPFTV